MTTLNDSRQLVRLTAFGMCLALGVIAGALLAAVFDAGSERVLWLLLVGSAIEVAVCLTMAVAARRADARLRTGVERCTHELVGGAVPPESPIPGRVIRVRRERKRTGGVIDSQTEPFGRLERARTIVVLTALPAASPPRRVAALVPRPAHGELVTGSVHLVHLLPGDSEAAVLNVRAAPGMLEAARQDPRWETSELPGELSIAGGLARAVGSAVVGVLAGLAFALLVVAVG